MIYISYEMLILYLAAAALYVAGTTLLVAALWHRGEALGAARRHIAYQFLLESAAMGLVGGILGASLGTLVVVGVSAYQSWTPVLDPLVPLAAPLIGGVTELVSGLYPSLRAARMEPVEALRSGT